MDDLISDYPPLSSYISGHINALELGHLATFTFDQTVTMAGVVTTIKVVVTFSCHCFTREPTDHECLNPDGVNWYEDGRERRVFCPERYALSLEFLPHLVEQLATRKITFTTPWKQNFMTFERPDAQSDEHYVVFFQPKREGKRIHLRVQSAYCKTLSKRERESRKINFETLIKSVYEKRQLKP